MTNAIPTATRTTAVLAGGLLLAVAGCGSSGGSPAGKSDGGTGGSPAGCAPVAATGGASITNGMFDVTVALQGG